MSTVQKEPELSSEELHMVMDRYLELCRAGRDEEAAELFDKHIPILPYLADTAKKLMGVEALLASGLNLSAAFKEFGDDWLERDD